MTLYAVIFYLLSAVAVVTTALAVTRRKPVHAVLYLVVAFLSSAALFYLLGAPLLAAFMVIVYAGAIMVLILFAIMLFQRSPRELGTFLQWGPATLLGVVFIAIAAAIVWKEPGSTVVLKLAVARPADFGRFLFERYWLAIEIVSVLFIVALVALIHLGKSKADRRVEGETRAPELRS
jgi:NADH-quinone oxidoreductase subunit J